MTLVRRSALAVCVVGLLLLPVACGGDQETTYCSALSAKQGVFSDHDKVIGDKIRVIFAKALSYEDALRQERVEFVDLCKKALSHARIKHMLETNKPLRN